MFYQLATAWPLVSLIGTLIGSSALADKADHSEIKEVES